MQVNLLSGVVDEARLYAWIGGAGTAAEALTKNDSTDDVGIMLLHDIRAILYDRQGMDRIPSRELSEILSEMQDRPWYDWPHYRGFSPHQMAILLGPFGIRPHPMWGDGHRTVRGYWVKAFEEAFDRYLAPSTELTAKQLRERTDKQFPKRKGRSLNVDRMRLFGRQ